MTDQLERVQIVQWILDKQLGWVAAADAKVAVVVALDTAVFAALATAYASAKCIPESALLMSLATSVLLVIALVCAVMSLLPRTKGPIKSLVFFGPIATQAQAAYITALRTVPLDHLCEDIAAQIHRNAEIAAEKHRWVRRSIECSFVAALPWATAVYLLIKQ